MREEGTAVCLNHASLGAECPAERELWKQQPQTSSAERSQLEQSDQQEKYSYKKGKLRYTEASTGTGPCGVEARAQGNTAEASS